MKPAGDRSQGEPQPRVRLPASHTRLTLCPETRQLMPVPLHWTQSPKTSKHWQHPGGQNTRPGNYCKQPLFWVRSSPDFQQIQLDT